jgi:hypothetical protein
MLRKEKLEKNIRNEKLKLETQRKKQIETKDKIKTSISKINFLRELRLNKQNKFDISNLSS